MPWGSRDKFVPDYLIDRQLDTPPPSSCRLRSRCPFCILAAVAAAVPAVYPSIPAAIYLLNMVACRCHV